MLTASEAHKLSNVGFDVNIKLDLIEKAIRQTAAEGKYALWYCFRAKNEFLWKKFRKSWKRLGTRWIYFMKMRHINFISIGAMPVKRSKYVKCIS